MKQKSAYTKARNIFLVLFLLSTGIVIVLGIIGASMRLTTAGPSIDVNPDLITIGGLVAIVSSCITSMVTFVGFVSTTILAWRKEAREKEDRELERKRKEIELEKARLDLEKMKGEQENQPPK
jgi:type VI protein secretion system component VasK